MKTVSSLLLFICSLFMANQLWASSAVVLTYHRVGEDDVPSTNVTIEQFEQQLDYLQKHNFNIWSLSKILATFDAGEALPERTVAITFDDAYLSVYSEAFPRLQSRNYPFTVFVSTDSVDMKLSRYMSWAQLREMKNAGVMIANHSKSHPYMVRYLDGESALDYQSRMKNEIVDAQQKLIDELGDAPMLFAYPYGEYSTELTTIVKSLGYYGIGQHSGAISAESNSQALARFPINEQYSDINDFGLKAKTYPLAIEKQSIDNPVWSGEAAPRLVITLKEGIEGLSELACYASGQGKMTIEWIDKKRGQFAVQAPKSLTKGRYRYTCTAPDKARRYQWFSQLWVVLPPA